ncbi:hypothetical protein KVT40_007680 [Elsinoe batatas]|uniref:CR-type domain-containing protein n=1 Tax=Elsinoe batatas TaxID=2601811 RepID=A0A8K0PEV5_9PEZI|nr:hypothetical protein KVT40_007680 [Elsinoe batatas]
MPDPGKSRSSSGSSGSSGSRSSSARSEFSLKHRQKTADPTCELCHGTGKYQKQEFRFEQQRCGPCQGTGRVRHTGRVGETRGTQGSVCGYCRGHGARQIRVFFTVTKDCACKK